MPLEPTKHVNGRMWLPGVSGNPNGRPVKPHGIFAWLLKKNLAEVWQEHGRDTILHTAKTQPATFFESPNECGIYLLRSLLRQTSCWVSAITGGTGPKITGSQHFYGTPEQGAPLFVGEVERGLFLFPWRPEERDSSLGGRYFNAKSCKPANRSLFLMIVASWSNERPTPTTCGKWLGHSVDIGPICGELYSTRLQSMHN